MEGKSVVSDFTNSLSSHINSKRTGVCRKAFFMLPIDYVSNMSSSLTTRVFLHKLANV